MFRDSRRSRRLTVLFVIGAFGALLAARRAAGEGRGGRPPGSPRSPRGRAFVTACRFFQRLTTPAQAPDGREVDFKHYHSYEETAALLKMWAAKYPDLVDLYSAASRSRAGDLQITITNKRTARTPTGPRSFSRRAPRRGDQRHRDRALLHQPRAFGGTARPCAHRAGRHQKRSTCARTKPDGNTLYH